MALGLEMNSVSQISIPTLYSNFNVFKVFAIPSGSSTRSMYLLYNTSPNVLNFIPEIDAAWKVAYRGSEVLSWKSRRGGSAAILQVRVSFVDTPPPSWLLLLASKRPDLM